MNAHQRRIKRRSINPEDWSLDGIMRQRDSYAAQAAKYADEATEFFLNYDPVENSIDVTGWTLEQFLDLQKLLREIMETK